MYSGFFIGCMHGTLMRITYFHAFFPIAYHFLLYILINNIVFLYKYKKLHNIFHEFYNNWIINHSTYTLFYLFYTTRFRNYVELNPIKSHQIVSIFSV